MKINMDVIDTKKDLLDYLSRIADKYIGEMETPQLIHRFQSEVSLVLNQAYQEGILDVQCRLIERSPGIWEITDENKQDTNQPS